MAAESRLVLHRTPNPQRVRLGIENRAINPSMSAVDSITMSVPTRVDFGGANRLKSVAGSKSLLGRRDRSLLAAKGRNDQSLFHRGPIQIG